MPKPIPPTPDVPITPLDPLYIPFTTIDPTGAAITVDQFPQKEPVQYRNIIEKLRPKLLAGDVLLPEAYAFAQTDTNKSDIDAWTITTPGAPTVFSVTGGSQSINTISWAKPVDEGTAGTITDYILEFATDINVSPSVIQKVKSTNVSFAILPIIAAAATYEFGVRAINEKGQGPLSNIVSVAIT